MINSGEWNTAADFVAYQTSEGVTYDPDVGGNEGTNCDFDPIFTGACNDFEDMDDLLPGGFYNTITPNSTTRATYFPKVDYN